MPRTRLQRGGQHLLQARVELRGRRRSLPTLARPGSAPSSSRPRGRGRRRGRAAGRGRRPPPGRAAAAARAGRARPAARVLEPTWPAAARPCPCSRRRSPRRRPALTSIRSMRPCRRSSPPASSAGARASSAPPKRSSNSPGAKAELPVRRLLEVAQQVGLQPAQRRAPALGVGRDARRRRRARPGRVRSERAGLVEALGRQRAAGRQRAQRVLQDAVGEIAAQHRLGVGLERGRAAAAGRRTTSPGTRRTPPGPTPTRWRAR